jgi:acyl-coenzyme A synthetase/AMP-(fatty) acid ligase
LVQAAREVARHCALTVPQRKWGKLTYRECDFEALNRETNAVALYLQSRGVVRGQRVLMMVRPGWDLIAVVFALFKLGAVPIVIDPGMGLKSFRACVAQSHPETLIGIRRATWVARVFKQDFSSVQKILTVGSCEYNRGVHRYRSCAEVFQLADTHAEELAAILFTSGSTGSPKGVCYTHGVFEAQLKAIRDCYRIEPGAIDLPMLPVFALFNPAFGATTVVPEMNPSRPASVNPARIVAAVERYQVSTSFGAPILWGKVARYCLDHQIQLPSLKRLIMAGATVSPEVIRDLRSVLPNCEIHTPYGATECLPISSISGAEILETTAKATLNGWGSCVGTVLEGMQVRIIAIRDEAWEEQAFPESLPAGEIGEIIVSGPVATQQYDELPEATRLAKIVDDSGNVWHRMGDLGYLDINGKLWFCGRKVERVQVAKSVLYTDCCEAIFNQDSEVFRSALIGLRHPHNGNVEPAIVIEPESGFFPKTKAHKKAFIDRMGSLAQSHAHTQSITHFLFFKKFPVDVRHNAKIHRLSLAKYFQSKWDSGVLE